MDIDPAAAAIAGTLVGLVGGVLSPLVRWGAERDERHGSTRRALTDARRDAYSQYLSAQQALQPWLMAIPASEDKTMPDARHKHLRDRPNSAGSKIYARSSATEMQAILISDDGVRSAIGDFETYISNALDKTLTDEHGRRGAGFSDAEWDQKLLELVEKMVDEQKVDRGEGRRGKRPSYF